MTVTANDADDSTTANGMVRYPHRDPDPAEPVPEHVHHQQRDRGHCDRGSWPGPRGEAGALWGWGRVASPLQPMWETLTPAQAGSPGGLSPAAPGPEERAQQSRS